MKILTGIDLVELKEFNESIRNGGENFLNKIFTKTELENSDSIHLAGIFASKEAIIKALSIKAGQWKTFEILNNKEGRPSVNFVGENFNFVSYDLSISHSLKYAIAIFVAIL